MASFAARPILTAPYYEEPMETDLLWGYEGLTDYLGPMLAARSGLWTPGGVSRIPGQHCRIAWPRPPRPHLASAARHGHRRARLSASAAEAGLHWRRGTDYYDEGDLLWLEVATIIHRESHGQKIIDDFCQSFHGGPNNGPEVKTYTFDELVSRSTPSRPLTGRRSSIRGSIQPLPKRPPAALKTADGK